MACELCEQTGGEVLWQDAVCRVVRAEERGYPGFCRVIWNAHTKEMTDLDQHDRAHLMHVVFAVEAALRELLRPHKVNLASFGNMTPHLHWHVIPRFTHDPHFPLPAWGEARREAPGTPPPDLGSKIAAVLAATLR
jgi:diadenosine tetraphosphate (Ap4A) HIT family hydrolase